MHVQAVLEFIQQTNGRIFSIKFTKRTDGSIREMVCRTGVTSHIKGTGAPRDWKKLDLISVFDMQKAAYRSIPVEGIFEVKVDGEWEQVQQAPRWSMFRQPEEQNPRELICVSTSKKGLIDLTAEELKAPMPYSLPSKDYERVEPCD